MNTKRYPSDKPRNYFECVPCIGGVLPTTVGRMVPGGYDPYPIPTWWFWGGGTPVASRSIPMWRQYWILHYHLTGYMYVVARHSYTPSLVSCPSKNKFSKTQKG